MKSGKQEDTVSEAIRDLGARYVEMRKQKGFTQKQIAEISGLSIFTISTFESGHSTGLTMATYIKLLRAIGCKNLSVGPGRK